MLKHLIRFFLLILPIMAAAEDFVLGKDYELITHFSGTTTKSKKIPVVEFFSYGCPWCYKIDPTLMNWVKKRENRLQFSRVPVIFHKDWLFYAKAYYTAESLNLDDRINHLLFKAVQNKNGPAMNSNQAMINFFIAQGVDSTTAKSAFEHSTAIDMQVAEGSALMSHYGIQGIPAVVVNKQYKTDLQMAKNPTRLLEILDFLLIKAQKNQKERLKN